MLGAIIGDTVGSVYEFDNIKELNFPLFGSGSTYTDDSIMSLAVAKWLMEDPSHSHSTLEKIMVDFGEQYPYPMGGYGGNFSRWLFAPDTLKTNIWVELGQGRRPYNSWGNGSAMRASAIGWMFDDIEETAKVAKISAAITHNHPEGIKGAQAVAEAVFLARNGYSKQKIKAFIQLVHEYDLSKSCDEIRETYQWDSSCQGTVPQAICAFLDSTDFESAIRLAVSLGGDSDTLTCITGAIAEAFYKEIPQDMIYETLLRLDPPLREVLDAFALSSHYINLYGSYNKKRLARRYTPDRIQQLKENEIFVFGSNLEGRHLGGAANVAHSNFGAIWGQGVGMQGQSYAIPTMHGGVEAIKPYVDEFIEYARQHPELTFLVTRIGCGIAGFKDEQMAPLFKDCLTLENVVLPKSFCDRIK